MYVKVKLQAYYSTFFVNILKFKSIGCTTVCPEVHFLNELLYITKSSAVQKIMVIYVYICFANHRLRESQLQGMLCVVRQINTFSSSSFLGYWTTRAHPGCTLSSSPTVIAITQSLHVKNIEIEVIHSISAIMNFPSFTENITYRSCTDRTRSATLI